MPQLNPKPWFAILVFSWLVFLILIPMKVMNHVFPYELSPKNTETIKGKLWTWPWH
uniref:ATP synthase F0 subunit 8 n=1 Tax=Thyrsites atun TaxID=499858 RepID=UPI0021D52F25|nr:ATP synthase F0 subunit 8 [Thyrsites atun]UXC97323.1 ATP synthase F0 subunit 8 [Thyrsites atun]UZP16863.1 ATP synthase F0 subunit 8 [Thyrsites atun]UZP16876.1 ATP synthase F0 subunit 8 [Thyrsites atun]UZP16889.1 ATP synthase F0 subunit 8 [Thyrsites atun]